MKLSREVKTGLIVTAAIGMLIYGFNFLKGRNIFSSSTNLYAIYKDIGGLVENNPVDINGLKVGQVKSVYMHPDNSGRVVVQLRISETGFKIPKNSQAKISFDLLGLKTVNIVLGDSKEYVQNNDTISGAIEENLKQQLDRTIAPLKKKVEEMIGSLDTVVTIVKSILDTNARQNLASSFESIKSAFVTFAKTARRLDTLVASEKGKLSVIFSKVESIATTISNNNDKLGSAISNFSNISDSLAKANIKNTLLKVNNAMDQTSQIMNKINKGEGSMGMLVNNQKLYNSLDSASVNLSALLFDMKKYPGRYFSLFGKKDRPPKKQKGKGN